MKLIYLLLAVSLVLNPYACTVYAHDKQPVQIEQQEEEKVTVGTWFKFIGYLCLFGLFSPPMDRDTEYITEVDGKDGVYNPQRKYKKEKGR
jgi:hypothetical protein